MTHAASPRARRLAYRVTTALLVVGAGVLMGRRAVNATVNTPTPFDAVVESQRQRLGPTRERLPLGEPMQLVSPHWQDPAPPGDPSVYYFATRLVLAPAWLEYMDVELNLKLVDCADEAALDAWLAGRGDAHVERLGDGVALVRSER